MSAKLDTQSPASVPQKRSHPSHSQQGNHHPALTAKQLALQLGIHWQTVLRWAREGIIPAQRGGGNYIRFDLSEVRQAMKENGVVRG